MKEVVAGRIPFYFSVLSRSDLLLFYFKTLVTLYLHSCWKTSITFQCYNFQTIHHLSYNLAKIRNKYSQKCNCAALSTFMYLWAICIFRRSVPLFCCIAFADRSWEYINRSQIHECRNWERGCAISFLGIFVSNIRCSSFAVYSTSKKNIFPHI